MSSRRLAMILSSVLVSSAALPVLASERGADADPGSRPVTLFFLDIRGGRVLALDPGARQPRVVVPRGPSAAPDGIVVDTVGHQLFWTNMGRARDDDGFVMRAGLDGSNVTTVVARGRTHTPKQVALDATAGKLYWSDREGMRVQRANLDGSELETLVTVAEGDEARADLANHCVGIAVDPAGGFIYWSQKGPDNGGVGSIRRAHVEMPPGETDRNRSDVEVLFAGLPEPIDLALDTKGGYVYWTDRGDDTINRGPLAMPAGARAETRSDRQILVRGVREAIGVALDLERGELYYTGLGGRLGRARLDGSDAVDLLSGYGGVLVGVVAVELP